MEHESFITVFRTDRPGPYPEPDVSNSHIPTLSPLDPF
jgi:hypothetical protein